jgi:putative hydrolase of the HAD superfamily
MRTGIAYEQLLSTWHEVWQEMVAELATGSLKMAQVRSRRIVRVLQRVSYEDQALAAEVDLLLGQELLDQLRCYEDIDMLARLRGRFKVAIVTNGADDDHPDSQRSKALRLGLLEQVDGFFASDAYGARKPEPSFFLAAAAALQVEPSDVVFVGDSPENDIAGANAGGMTSVLLWRRGGEPPRDHPPHHVIRSLYELEPILDAGEQR